MLGVMVDLTAIKRDTCPACGGQAEWQPKAQALVCTYCGTESPGELNRDTGEIQEIDLVATLRDMPEDLRGWRAEKKTVRCRHCKAVTVFDSERVAQHCDFCGSPALVDYDEVKSPIRPLSLLPFKIDETRVRESMRQWFAKRWFAPNTLRRMALVDTLRGVYIPYWTFDAQAHADWTATAGEYYYVSRTVRDSNGKTRTVQDRKTRWFPASGSVDHFFDDAPVPASVGIHSKHLKAVEPFPTNDLVPYDTAYLSGFVVEHYQVVLIDAAAQARNAMDAALRNMCIRDIPGDTHRNLNVDASYDGQSFKHILVPVWLMTYTFGQRSFQVVINGYTGATSGDYPKSAWKIIGAVVAGVIALVVIALIAKQLA